MGAERSAVDDAAAEPSDGERAWREAQVDAALEPWRSRLSADDLAWLRERMLEAMREDGGLDALARAAFPREVDQSGEVFYRTRGKPR